MRDSQPRATTIERDLQAVHRFAEQLLAEHSLRDWSVFWTELLEDSDGGGVTRAFTKSIVLSAAHLAVLTRDERRDVVRHEVAHALVGPAAEHCQVWQDKAVELGGTGLRHLQPPGVRYGWFGLCPDQHPFVSMLPPGPDGFMCEDESHDEPVPVERWKRNHKLPAHDPGVKRMAQQYPEPPATPTFAAGDAIYIIPFGHATLDNARATITAVGGRTYTILVDGESDEVELDFAGAAAQPS